MTESGGQTAAVATGTGAVAEGAPVFRRVLLKISGEALMGSQPFGLDEAVVAAVADEIRDIHAIFF
jgi:uridylate kinase